MKTENEIMGVIYKQKGKEQEAIDNLYFCEKCHTYYLTCDCDKKLKALLDYEDDTLVLYDLYENIIDNYSDKETRSNLLKNVKDLIEMVKKRII